MTSSHIGLHQNVEMCFQEKATPGEKKKKHFGNAGCSVACSSPPALVWMENLKALMVEELDFKTSMSPFFLLLNDRFVFKSDPASVRSIPFPTTTTLPS